MFHYQCLEKEDINPNTGWYKWKIIHGKIIIKENVSLRPAGKKKGLPDVQ